MAAPQFGIGRKRIREALDAMLDASLQMQQAALALVESGLSLRDAGELLGVTRQRVDQLLKDLIQREPQNQFRILEARERSA